MKAIGVMSGTSGDGVDAVLVELDDPAVRHVPRVLGHAYVPFDLELRSALQNPAALPLPRVAALHFELPRLYAQAIRQLSGWSEAACVGMHGQTVWHSPPSRGVEPPHTLQLGSSGVLAAELELPVVGDLRAADVARGGEGAPIMPLCHWFFSPPGEPRLVVNVGGIANYTYVASELEAVTASDLGPGMMLTDALAAAVSRGQQTYDRDGSMSRGGVADPAMVEHILANPFFSRPTPRSTGREDFGAPVVAELLARFGHLAPADLLTSSLTATARAIARAAEREVPPVEAIVLTGGGALHPGLRALVTDLAAPVRVEVAQAGPWAPALLEAAGMALIGARTLHRLPSALPQVTGARRGSVLGHVHWP